MSTKQIAKAVNQKYKTVWGYIDRTTKAAVGKASGGNGDDMASVIKLLDEVADMTVAEKKEIALVLKLQGMSIKEIASKVGMKYKTLWGFFDQQRKATGSP